MIKILLPWAFISLLSCASTPNVTPAQNSINEIDERIEEIEAQPETPENRLVLSTLRRARADISAYDTQLTETKEALEISERNAAEVQKDATRWQVVKWAGISISAIAFIIGVFFLTRKIGIF